MVKNIHEIRDPIHVFITISSDERKVLDSRFLQRLRSIHQLGLTYLLYPGATHKRFEHSLGVMELAGKVFDVVTDENNLNDKIRGLIPEVTDKDKKQYWRRVLRMAALCHDIGHLPFSHAAEVELLPKGWNHERFTKEMILSEEMKNLWENMTPPLRATDIVKLAVEPSNETDLEYSNWEAILSEIITGDSFGVDRIDYLLRDSHHTGVGYGRFDHHRLIDTLRVLPSTSSDEPSLGVQSGGIHSAEALVLARYFMFNQVYLHPVRCIYDIHLQDFLKCWLQNGKFDKDIYKLLDITDHQVLAAIDEASKDEDGQTSIQAVRITKRQHFKKIYERNIQEIKKNPDFGDLICDALKNEFGESNIKRKWEPPPPRASAPDFPVERDNGDIVSCLSESQILNQIPPTTIDYIFIKTNLRSKAEAWLKENRQNILNSTKDK